jgi:hypothetical protein
MHLIDICVVPDLNLRGANVYSNSGFLLISLVFPGKIFG